jgi:membrane-associated two-gene conflict system component 1 (EACC1)
LTGDFVPIVSVESQSVVDDLLAMHDLMIAHPRLRGHAQLRHAESSSGGLGLVPEGLALLLAPGVATAAASVLISWLRNRAGPVTVSITRRDGSTRTVTAANVRTMTVAQVAALLDEAGEAAASLAANPRRDA